MNGIEEQIERMSTEKIQQELGRTNLSAGYRRMLEKELRTRGGASKPAGQKELF